METVISCVKIKEVQGKPVYAIGLSDGQGGESFAVQIPVGTPVSDLTIESTQYGNRIKLKKANSGGTWGGSKRSGNESFALSYAKDLVVGGKVELKDILSTAEKLYAWLERKKQDQPAPVATPPTQGTTPIKPVSQTVTDDLPY